jgi:hypothetical protein
MRKITTVNRASRAARLQILVDEASRALSRIRIVVTNGRMARIERMPITGQLSKIATDFMTTIYHHGGAFPSYTFDPSLFSHPATRIFWNLPLKDRSAFLIISTTAAAPTSTGRSASWLPISVLSHCSNQSARLSIKETFQTYPWTNRQKDKPLAPRSSAYCTVNIFNAAFEILYAGVGASANPGAIVIDPSVDVLFLLQYNTLMGA